MSTDALRNAKYKDLGETWYSHQAARIVQRHIQFGRHCRLDLDCLLAGMARRIRCASLDSEDSDDCRHLNRDVADAPSVSRPVITLPKNSPLFANQDGADIAIHRTPGTRGQTDCTEA
jgi:hypothetical protein